MLILSSVKTTIVTFASSERSSIKSLIKIFHKVCLILPRWKKVSGGPELAWVPVLSAGRGIGMGWVVGLIL